MNQLGYLDFDVLFEKSGEEYVVRVLNSPSGQASAPFSLPFSPFEIENLLLRIGRTRKGVRRLESPEMEASRAFGSRLFSAVFADEVLACLRSSLNTSYRKGMGLRLRMRLSNTPELLDLPWEFLFDPTRNQFLVLSVDTPLVRYLDLQQEVQPLAVTPPINVLAMIASPIDYPPLDVAHEWEKLNEALGDLITRGLVSLTRLEKADLGSLQRALRRGRYHVFHFIGHGGFDTQAQDGVLLTEGEGGRGRPVSGYDLGTLLHDHRSLRLAVLNACEGARTSLTDPFAGTAQSLVQNGIPAVIAMQFEITDEAAIILAHEFYGALADSYPVDAALAEARKAIFAQGSDVEWATPVLYLRTPDAAIFQIGTAEKPAPIQVEVPPKEEAPVEGQPEESQPTKESPVVPIPGTRTSKTPEQVKAEVDRLYTQGLSAFWLDEWGQAILSFEAVLQLQPDHAEAAARLETARRNMELDHLYREAQAAEVAGDWRAAGATLEQLVSLSPTYRDAQTRLEAARLQCELVDLHAEARQLSQAGEWQAVVKIFERIAELEPQVQDPEGLLTKAKEELAAEQEQAELEALYHRGVMALDAGRWEEAAGLLRQVQVLESGYAQSERLLARAEAELARVPAPPEVEATAPTPAAPEAMESVEETSALPKTDGQAFASPAGEWRAAARPALRPGLWVAGGWFLAGLVAFWFISSSIGSTLVDGLDTITNYSLGTDPIGYLFFILVSGPLSGLALGIALHRIALRLSTRQFLGLVSAWTVVGLLPMPFYISGWVTTAYILAWTLAGGLGGWATVGVLRRAGAHLDRQAKWTIILGWAIGLVFGTLVFRENSEIAFLLGFAAEGFIGGLATFATWFRQVRGGGGQTGSDLISQPPAPLVEADQKAARENAAWGAAAPSRAMTAGWISDLRLALRPALWLAAGWFLASLVSALFFFRAQGTGLVNWISSGSSFEYFDLQLIFSGLAAGLLGGLVLGFVLKRFGLNPTSRHFLALMLIWGFIFLAMAARWALDAPLRTLSWIVAGGLGGWLTSGVLRRAGSRYDRYGMVVLVIGWAAAFLVGRWFIEVAYDQNLLDKIRDQISSDLAYRTYEWFISLGHAAAGFIGGLATFAALFNLGKKNN
jgi:tetratricopeptide (TPR) repeat protein